MFGQDFDPLSDNAPPRYAFESDDEDETVGYPMNKDQEEEPKKPEIKMYLQGSGQPERQQILLIANGDFGEVWARGAALGDQVGQVWVNNFVIGLVFQPSWLGHTVIVSETLHRLPADMMHDYAEWIMEKWKPSKLILLDSYSTSTYAANEQIPHDEAPVRYLKSGSTDKKQVQDLASLEPFAPPNLLQSTTAAFLAIASIANSSSDIDLAFSILMPSPKTSRPLPRTVVAREERYLHADDWDLATMIKAHKAICSTAGCESREWAEEKGIAKAAESRRKSILDEGNMYI